MSKQNPPSISFHFDGSITKNHLLTLRSQGKTLSHIQSAIDRAYLDVKYESVFKYQKIKSDEYDEIEFWAAYPLEGGFKLTAIADQVTSLTRSAIDRFNTALGSAYAKSIDTSSESNSLPDQAKLRSKIFKKLNEADDFSSYIESNEQILSRSFGERSINKEADQFLSLIRLEKYQDSTLELSMFGTSQSPVYTFDSDRAVNFHRVISQRRLGDPLICRIELRALDAGRPGQIAHGKVKNLQSGKDCNIFIPDPKLFGKLTSHLRKTKRKKLEIVACPVLEYNAWDPISGDLFVIELLSVIAEDD